MKHPAITLLLTATVLGGCGSTTTVDDYRPVAEPIDIGTGEKVAILGRRDAGHYETDRDFINCLGNRLSTILPQPWRKSRQRSISRVSCT